MTLYLRDPDVELHLGDALEILRELPNESVHCVATSPPFFGLRDYGTGRWEGGDEGCDHVAGNARNDTTPEALARRAADYGTGQGAGSKVAAMQYRDTCGKCGARRIDQQIGLEASPDEWASRLVEVFREARRVLRRDGSLWVECGDSYAASWPCSRRNVIGEGSLPDGTRAARPSRLSGDLKTKDLMGNPFLLAFALRADGWYWRGCNIWAKPNAMPESAKDRCTVAHSYVLHFSKSARYFFDGDAISAPVAADSLERGYTASKFGNGRGIKAEQNPDRNDAGEPWNVPASVHPRSVWTIPTQGFPEAHFATWPEALARRIILAAVPEQVCSVCGKARERIVGVTYESTRQPGEWNAGKADGALGRDPSRYAKAGVASRVATTTGFTDCGHNAYRPGVVLDPFAGSGTTAYVARKLGRRSIGIDLNESYLEMAARRLQQQSLFADAHG